MSMVLRDGGYPQMTHNDWEIVQAPKAQGTWNFHSAFVSVFLHLFVPFGSVSGQW
ncbi:hypothetical protein sscle_04g035120 [Sclerotinia sclerotiorum 1980 UF-70]|uniref:Ketoreductase (KR) domain-containing protein n=1 Tax=Sclerotinia sclerotiorum (strain ATCC 18683 / 1980 / Ss-1) TaxID=665079 RepID=A0A1D9Q1N1_SCLS1|nr:hypothetical protein sscle_04g035120 [Sclerotinia sclerotiorum 1980 UF-70]